MKMMGLSVAMETEIRDFVPDKGWNGISTKVMPHKTHCNIEPVKVWTEFTNGQEYKLPIPLIRFLLDAWILKPQLIKIINKSLQNLKLKLDLVSE